MGPTAVILGGIIRAGRRRRLCASR
jgi:hypothetical protein